MRNDKLIPYKAYSDGWLLSDPKRQYTPAANTDILRAFKRMGWAIPSEAKESALTGYKGA